VWAAAAALGGLLGGCASEPAPDDEPWFAEEDVGAADIARGARVDPLRMPKAIMEFEAKHDWGNHHVEWHTVRRWDLLEEASRQWAERRGWHRANAQEGAVGNGFEFLAMHRAMIRVLKQEFPRNAALLDGWKTPPTDPRDRADPLPAGATDAFDPEMARAIAKLSSDADLATFRSDDELGRYIESNLRPTSTNPRARAKDKATGIHNYLHVRFMDPESPIDIGDPTVNLGNKRFWRLHGWIDGVWTRYRALKGLPEDEERYRKEIEMATEHLLMPATVRAPRDPMPEELRHIFEL